MALARRSRGGMTGWVAAALLLLAVYATSSDPAADPAPDATVEVAADR